MSQARFIGADGVEYVSVNTAQSPAFARACVDAWTERDGKNRRHLLRHGAVTVPAAVLDRARDLLTLRQKEGTEP